MKTVLYLLCFVVVACLLSSSALALTPFGPPVATLDKGQFAVGFGYSHSKGDLEISALGLTAIAKDIEVDTYLANLVFGLTEDWELQIDLGVSETGNIGFESTGDFTGGFILRGTFAQSDKIKWGVASSVHWYSASASGVILGVPYTEEDFWTELQFAIGPSYKDGAWCLYGGPFLHFIDGEGDVTIGGIPFSGDFEQDSIFGGFVGAQVDLNDNTSLGIEYQFTGSTQAIGASILFRF